MNILVFDKELTTSLLKTLSLSELKCRCAQADCWRTLILKSSIDSYEKVREEFAEPLRITSGYRCQKHNAAVGGHPKSYHMIGAAMDLVPIRETASLDELEKIAKKYYDVVVRYDMFIHCHNFGDKG